MANPLKEGINRAVKPSFSCRSGRRLLVCCLLFLLPIHPVFSQTAANVSLQNQPSSKPLVQGANCTLYYHLQGTTLNELTRQQSQLQSHFRRQKITLVDLQANQQTGLSGREKMRIRNEYQLPRNKNVAVLVNAKGKAIKQFSDDVDLVSVLLACPL